MAILAGDIELLKSEVLDDVDNGGGKATGNAVADGVSNNLFPDISELDRTYGRIALRKVFPSVVTDNTETYFGAHVIVAKPPSDEKVSATIFTTRDWFDQRSDAKNNLESYLSMGALSRWMLYGTHISGQRSLQLLCKANVASPSVDDVIALVKRDDSSVFQYVRVSRILSRIENQEFEDTRGTFYFDVVTVELTDELRFQFSAWSGERYTSDWYNPPTKLHTTIAADAASYYGIQPLALAAQVGDLTVKAESIYTQLVPSALAETPIIDARCAGPRATIIPIGAANVSFTSAIELTAGSSVTRYFGHAVARGSISVTIGGTTLTDDSNGNLPVTAGLRGSVDYETGSVTVISVGITTTTSATYIAKPAAAVSDASHTSSISISSANRGYTYVSALYPPPAPGTITASYMSQGKWYSMFDDGSGNLSGDEGSGAGSVNYATGSAVITLGALPDADTEILYSWGSPTHYESHSGSSVFEAPTIVLEANDGALTPSSVTATYMSGGISRTVTDNGTGGLTGAGSGYVDYIGGKVFIVPSLLPDAGTNIELNYTNGSVESETFPAAAANVTSFSLATAVKPGTVSLKYADQNGVNFYLTDDANGSLVLRSIDTSGSKVTYELSTGYELEAQAVRVTNSASVGGSINYGTGAVSLSTAATLAFKTRTTFAAISGWTESVSETRASSGIQVKYRASTDSSTDVKVQSVQVPALTLKILPTVANTIVPGSLRFTLGGSVYVDRAGVLVKSPSNTTNSGVSAGTINYETGKINLTSYAGAATTAFSVTCLTRNGVWSDWNIRFRTAGAPLQVSSLYVSANRADTGAQISGTSDATGDISGTYVDGNVVFSNGIANLRFGQMVPKAGNEAEWWFDAANVVGTQVFKPILVYLDTARYNAVVTSSLPLSADILGLDPVRLPADGRVPMVRRGDVVVVHHQDSTTPQTVTNGQTVNVGRTRLAKIRVVGNNGNTISSGYTENLDAGSVTFNDVTGYSQPVHIEHRIEDMALVSDVQINGQLSVTRPLTHDFPLGSYISSALVIGDMHARVSEFFDQQTFNGWFDTLQGNAASGTYNDTLYPIELTNRGAIEERWEILFTNSTTVNVIGENVGQIVTGHPITSDLAPINPAQGAPYFTMRALGFGSGWSAGNVIRLNTKAANFPVWVARTVLQGNPTLSNDAFTIAIRGDVNA